ncbi:MAG: hypothetical protein M0R75_13360 [Dehalococcoidia bacterium]|nr:hypothetical protein [Dehalococcoidia bacterium]
MHLETLDDIRAEIARRRLSQQSVAEEMGRSAYSISHLMSWNEDVHLTPVGAARFSKAIESAATKQEAGAR